MNVVFFLQHVSYEDTQDEDVKDIGVFSSEETARSAIEYLKNLEGFRKFKNSFIITRKKIDQISWDKGFIE